jgi:hypothetical protein
MVDGVRGYDVVVDFWEWYRRREARLNPLASYALEQCEKRRSENVIGMASTTGMQSTYVNVQNHRAPV